jgi:hypothetical protein
MILPTTIQKAISKDPQRLLIFSSPKVGKTSLVTKLPNCLIIDLEGSSDYFDGMFIDITKVAAQQNISKLNAFKEVIKSLKAQKAANKNVPIYDYIAIDSTSALEDLARDLGNIRYKESSIGKGFTGDILNLPNGAGYGILREAFETLYCYFDEFYNKGLILLAHTKNSSITKNGIDLSCKDVNLTGRLKQIVTSQMDAIGFLRRNKGTNENILSFKTDEQDLVSGARPMHLRQKEFIISRLLDNNELEAYWEQIYLDLKK